MEYHKLTKFFLIISIFITGISVLAIYSSMIGAEYSIKKDDTQTQSLIQLVKSQHWWNNYQAKLLRNVTKQLFQMQIDILNQSASQHMPTLSKYQSYLSNLHAHKSVTDSLANLANQAQTEEKLYDQSIITSSHYANLVEWYDYATILLIIGIGLGGISEIAKNKLLGYPYYYWGIWSYNVIANQLYASNIRLNYTE